MEKYKGWEIICNKDIEVRWKGGIEKKDLIVKKVEKDYIYIENLEKYKF